MEIGKPCLKYIGSFKTSVQKQPFADVFTNYIFKPLQNSQENSYAEISARCFPVNFTKILRKPHLLDFDSANLLSV